MKKFIIIILILCLIGIIVYLLFFNNSSATDASTSLHHNKNSYQTISGLFIHNVEEGLPSEISDEQIEVLTGFTLSYNESYEGANWVAYILTRKKVENKKVERNNKFHEDKNIKTGSAFPFDYRQSGYDKGHLAPAADMCWSEEAMKESFLMSNMSPQEPKFNRGIWKKLEEKVRDWAITNDSLYVVTGPIIKKNSKTIGKKNHIAIPYYFFKVIVDISYPDYKAIAFIMENKELHEDIFRYAVTVDSVEKVTGINFFSKTDSQTIEKLESTIDIDNWK